MSSTIRLRLNEILIEKQMSRRQLAKQTSLRPNTVNDLCTQPIQPLHISTLSAFCNTLHVSIQDLLLLEIND
ncbi:helix-turn-helix domain-containing protein [Lysinibacillus fusiformis]|uniref:helix-turn-helix domain-containing protein n=1 Tax=Lysinibacillus fusiformis TaxID=28031 RepID=UPI0037B8D1BB